MENDSRPAEEVQAKIKALAEEYETLTGDKLLVRRIKSHRPQEIWAWMNSLAHEYSVITGKKFDSKKDQPFPIRLHEIRAERPRMSVHPINSKRGQPSIAPSVAKASMR